MQITSRFDINDKVWFYRNKKYYEGIILAINSWNEYDTFIYRVQHDDLEESFTIFINERDIFGTESDIPQNVLVHYEMPVNPDPEPDTGQIPDPDVPTDPNQIPDPDAPSDPEPTDNPDTIINPE